MNQFLAILVIAIIAGVFFAMKRDATRKPSVLVLGASDMSGGYFDATGKLCRLASLVQTIAEVSGLPCIDLSISGLQLRELLTGGRVAFSADPNNPDTIKSLKQILHENSGCQYVILTAGTNDVLFGGRTLDEFDNDLSEAIEMIVTAGMKPILRGTCYFAETQNMPENKVALAEAINLAFKDKADDCHLPFFDVRSVAWEGQSDTAPDGLHPGERYARAMAVYQGQELARIAAS